jgi:hypothetical protein
VIDSKETKLLNPGIARKEFGKVDPSNPKTLIVETHNSDYKRKITVYIPAQYKLGSEAPFMVVFISVGGQDLLNPNVMRDGMHDWVEANNRMAKVLKAKGYEYQYLFCRGSGHSVGNAWAQFLPHAIEWVWKGYAPKNGE